MICKTYFDGNAGKEPECNQLIYIYSAKSTSDEVAFFYQNEMVDKEKRYYFLMIYGTICKMLCNKEF